MTTANPTMNNTLNGRALSGAGDYNATAKFLHWFAVALMLLQFPLGWLMPPTGRDQVPAAAVNMHFSIGMMILILFAIRFAWRLAHPVAMKPSLPGWQKKLAHGAHSLLYALVFATLLAGWAHASVRGWPIKLFGLFPVSPIGRGGSETGHLIGSFHATFACMFLALIVIHVAGVLFHEFVQRDGILARMLPQGAGR